MLVKDLIVLTILIGAGLIGFSLSADDIRRWWKQLPPSPRRMQKLLRKKGERNLQLLELEENLKCLECGSKVDPSKGVYFKGWWCAGCRPRV